MRLLDRYLLREFLVPLGYCLGGFLVFWLTFDLFTEMGNFQRNQLRAGDIAEYYFVKAPEILVVVVPIGLLLALLYALTSHARHHELTAIRAAGLTLWRMALPYFAVASLAGGALFLMNEFLVPEGAERAERILHRWSSSDTNAADRQWLRSVDFENQRDRHAWHIGAYHLDTFEMRKVHVGWVLEDGSRRTMDAERAVRTNDAWMFFDVQLLTLPTGGSEAQAAIRKPTHTEPELTETPRLIQSEIKISRLDSIKTAKKAQLGVREIRDYLELHPQLDAKRRDLLRTTLHSRFAAPWTCVVVVLISLPFGAASGRRNAFVGVASSVFIVFAFYVCNELCLSLGGRGEVPPWLAAWATNLLFGGAGAVMTQRTR
ncbi:MAG: LptF/LptG family permease [Verrucomicrobia bacterium]|nr:LptF/LptG family permease [Verrucomicrobiota bacterium]